MPDAPTTTIRVKQSDTLWEIAKECSPAGTPTASTVEYICEINRLEGSALAAGQVLEVPCEEGIASVALHWE